MVKLKKQNKTKKLQNTHSSPETTDTGIERTDKNIN